MTSLSVSAPATRGRRLDGKAVVWGATLGFVALCVAARGRWAWVDGYPASWTLPLAPGINRAADWIGAVLQPVTRGGAHLLEQPMRGLAAALAWLPWPTTVAITASLALASAGRKLALFAVATCFYILLTGYWRQSLNTLTLVALAIPCRWSPVSCWACWPSGSGSCGPGSRPCST